MNRSTLDLWVGIFVTIGIAAILFLALKVGNLLTFSNEPGYRIEAAFDNIGALKLRAPVKAAGVVVGRVERIRLDPQTYQAVVSMRIDRGFEFSRDTIASILTSGLLGEVYVGLSAGGDTKMLANGDRIAKTQSAIVLEKLIGSDSGSFWANMQAAVDFRYDIVNGIIKSVVFGTAVSAIAVFEGYNARPTAEGVSTATTRTVVGSSLAILALDFVLTVFMFRGVH